MGKKQKPVSRIVYAVVFLNAIKIRISHILKGEKGEVVNFISERRAIKKLQITTEQFR
jgi:hypothetical protein